MKLYYYDSKHEQVHYELNLGDLSSEDQALLDRVIDWMQNIGLLDGRYRDLVVADGYKYEREDPEDDPVVVFE
jgi:hypothetical protein